MYFNFILLTESLKKFSLNIFLVTFNKLYCFRYILQKGKLKRYKNWGGNIFYFPVRKDLTVSHGIEI